MLLNKLRCILKSQNKRINPLLLFILIILSVSAYGSTKTLIGTVENIQTHNPLKNVNITIKGTNFGTTTDNNGYFKLDISRYPETQKILFTHVGFSEKTLTIKQIKKQPKVRLQSINIEMSEVKVEVSPEVNYTQELTNEITILTEKDFSSGGYIDVADLMSTENSIMIDENLSGKKTISIRGANANETIILYDGIPINSSFNRVFDLSLLDPSSLSQIDIVKGGNLATFDGAGAAAVLNFIPKLEQDYLIKFYQRFGSYNSGNWGTNLYKKIADLKIFASMNQGASYLNYADEDNEDETIDRTSENITVNARYDFNIKQMENALKFNYIKSIKTYANNAFKDSLDMSQDLITLKYQGDYSSFGKTVLAFSTNKETEKHHFYTNDIYYNFHDISNDNNLMQFEYVYPFRSANFFLGFKQENIESILKEEYYKISSNKDKLSRISKDYSAGFKLENLKSSSSFDLQSINFNYSMNTIRNDGDAAFNINSKAKNKKSSYMISSIFSGDSDLFHLKTHFNYSNDFRLPTPYQQLISNHFQSALNPGKKIVMEHKSNFELGAEVSDLIDQFDCSFSAIYFKSSYENKYREIQLSGSPIVFLDNFKDTNISGFEGKIETSFNSGKYNFGFTAAKYSIEQKIHFRMMTIIKSKRKK